MLVSIISTYMISTNTYNYTDQKEICFVKNSMRN